MDLVQLEVGEILESIKGLIIGSFLAFLGYYIAKFSSYYLQKYLRWNMSIQGERNYYEKIVF